MPVREMVWFCLGLALFLVDSSSGWISSSRTTATSFWDTYKSSGMFLLETRDEDRVN